MTSASCSVASPLTVVQLHSHDYGGGAEAVMRLNHRGLESLGHRASAIVANKSGTDSFTRQLTYQRGIPGSRRVAKWMKNATGLQNVYAPSFRSVDALFGESPDVVHLHAMHGAQEWADLAGLARLANNYPLVCSLQDLWWLTGHCAYGMQCERWKTGCGQCPDLQRYPAVPRDGTAWNWRRKKAFLQSHPIHLIAPSDWVKSQCQQSPILRECPITVVPNPIDVQAFTAEDRLGARERLKIPASQKTILIAANHLDSLFKGAREAVEVVNLISDTDTLVILVGRNCDQVADHIKLPSRSLGYKSDVNEMADCYRSADVFVIPSKVETFGLVAAEAVACGTAVVSFHAGGLKEVVESCHGIAVTDGDVVALADATRSLLDADQERISRAQRGRKTVLQNYSPTAHAQGCVDVYRTAIQEQVVK
ncbi:D-inositol 3-phosphate glycosyltransferase [Stieleria neptunia]|uniref:D-inositol 3-phosphate glycosyltransferase n=1 Tax=Stieleria neptunia TaxID=2527979 RepID=A0A518HQL7_9BACT|nr:glycosyltransferase [Stieleria neptunia]QDV43145.1 D-inositol 3-phosphate glycosyltransferase [Stieleria neptunia]